jgi:photosystem II stability/assembly factor-like uncharacterized protein
MNKIRIHEMIALTLFTMIFVGSNASADNQLIDMKLLTSKIGWVATEKELYWTANAGNTWHIITPQWSFQGHIAAVFFINTSQGWVLCCKKSDKIYKYNLAYTNDSGINWSITDLKLSTAIVNLQIKRNNREDYVEGDLFEGSGWIDFLDHDHGWILLEYHVSARSDYSSGILLKTEDGGKSWKQIEGDLPIAGRFHFVTTKEGWLAGHIVTDLYVTHNGGTTWQEATYPSPPPQVSTNCWHDLPIFKDTQNGFLPVTYVSDDLVLFITHDGGKTWKIDRMLPNLEGVAGVIPSTMVDSVLITIAVSESEHSLTLIKLFPDGKTVETKTYAFTIKGDIRGLSLSKWWKLNFITSSQGWISTGEQLLSTSDGGATWTVITP